MEQQWMEQQWTEQKGIEQQMNAYLHNLEKEERSQATRKQYQRELCCFFAYLNGQTLTKEVAVAYKNRLEQQYQPSSVNTKLAALNGFFSFIARSDLHLKLLKIQRKVYSSAETELSKEEYLQLVKTANHKHDEKLSLLLQTICSTGIRVSEVKYITVEAVKKGEALIRLKGKTRTILIPQKLQACLKVYICRKKITAGAVFVTENGQPLDRSNIWKMLKALSKEAGIDEKKVFPHNLRHLFAKCFYAVDKDLAKLADILGHSNINTTRIYIMTSGIEHGRRLDALGLVV